MSAIPLDSESNLERIIAEMTLEEKLAQLVGLWLELGGSGGEGADIAPMQHEMLSRVADFETFVRHGLGQLTRPLGSQVSDITHMVRAVNRVQDAVVTSSRFGIPALVHEEILTGLQLYGATTYPAPLAWGSTWDDALVERMGERIGSSMRELNIHLGLAPVLDVIRDPRWGRVEECIAEDPYLVGVVASAYVRGVQSQGVGATLKHFLAYSNSQAGRNLAPVHAGPREIAEVFALPFEMAVKLAKPQAVMHSYAEIDGIPVAADESLLTGLLRDRWGFEGTVVADYFGVAFLHTLHNVAADLEEAAQLGFTAGVDVELPTGNAYLEPLANRVRSGAVAMDLVDQSVRRVLRQKLQLGAMVPPVDPNDAIDLDRPESREVARILAEESVILLSNPTGALPISGARTIALVGPNADSAEGLMGNYSFTNHVVVPDDTPMGISVPTIRERLLNEFSGADIGYFRGCTILPEGESDADQLAEIQAAVDAASRADICVAVVGDRAGLFGRGTVGEGSDTELLELPGRQRELVEALLETGTPLVLVLVTGRPYPIADYVGRAAAVIQSFFPGEEGASAVVGVLSGRINPSGRLPVSMPKNSGGQPYSYRHPLLGGVNPVSNIDPAPTFPFGHGLSYTKFEHEEFVVTADEWTTAGILQVECRVTNVGPLAGADVVQLYMTDVAATVTRPLRQLLGWARVELAAGESRVVTFSFSADRLALVGRGLDWIVEPGEFDLIVARSAIDAGVSERISLSGPTRTVGEGRALLTSSSITSPRLSPR